MRRLLKILGVLVGLVALAAAAIIAVSESGAEVVTIHTLKAGGRDAATRLWVVDDDGAAWLRAGMGQAGWVSRAEAEGALEMVRGGTRQRYKVTVRADPASRLRIHDLMRRKYGWQDEFIDLIRDGENSLAVRLDLIEGDVR